MKCIKCGKETGAKWKKLCYACYKKQHKRQSKRQSTYSQNITQETKPEEETWRKTSLCHTCREKDECPDGQKRNRTYGAIIRDCTSYSPENDVV